MDGATAKKRQLPVNNKIANMHMIEVVDEDKDSYTMPIAAVEDVPRQEWFDLMVECGGHVDSSANHLPGGGCPTCIEISIRIEAAKDKPFPDIVMLRELLDWLDQGAAEAMRFRALLLKGGVK